MKRQNNSLYSRKTLLLAVLLIGALLLTACKGVNSTKKDDPAEQDPSQQTPSEKDPEDTTPSGNDEGDGEPTYTDKEREILNGKNTDPDLRSDYDLPVYDGVTVTLSAPEHCSILSQNPVTVSRYEDASFRVFFEDNYTFSSSYDGLVYQDGCIVLCEVEQDAEVTFKVAKRTELCKFFYVQPAQDEGTASSTVLPGTYTIGHEITVTASVAENKSFIGWSVGDYIANGGSAVSYSPEYTFKIDRDTALYPNFMLEGVTIISYDLNGGVLKDDGVTDKVQTQFNRSVRLCPNLMPDIGTFVREGYTLLEYTENKDGTGQAVNPGGIAVIGDEDGVYTFYAQWSKWTSIADFDYTSDGMSVTITRYYGDAKTLSIPAKIGGLPVRVIAAGAVVNKNFETLVIPSSVLSIADSAFVGCMNFDSLYICDTFTGISDKAFSGCKAFSHLQLNAGQLPHYSYNAESITTRLENIIHSDKSKPTIVLVGGSSCLYGIYSPILDDGLSNRYNIINAGTNAGGTGVLYMEGLSHFMKAGDIFLNVPEYGNVQMGQTAIYWRCFRATEQCYNIFRYADFSHYTGFFSAMSEFNYSKEARGGNSASVYEKTNTALSAKYSDMIGVANDTNKYNGSIFSVIGASANSLGEAQIATYNRLIDTLDKQGILFYFGSAPIYTFSDEYIANHNGVTNSADSGFIAFYEKACDRLNCSVICDPLDYRFYETEYFNSAYHLTSDAARVRTTRLLTDLIAQLDRDSLPY